MEKENRMTQHGRSWKWTVHYWKTHKGFGAGKTRKFRTFDDAKRFISGVHDDGCETWLFGGPRRQRRRRRTRRLADAALAAGQQQGSRLPTCRYGCPDCQCQDGTTWNGSSKF